MAAVSTSQGEGEMVEVVRRALAPLVRPRLRSRIVASASLLRDLGMDSLRVVELTLRLERAVRRPIFLPEWIASVDDPDELTVGSLAAYLERQVAHH